MKKLPYDMQDSLKTLFLLMTIKFISSFHRCLKDFDAQLLENVMVMGYQRMLYKFGSPILIPTRGEIKFVVLVEIVNSIF